MLINLRSVGNYARFEYWFAMIKVATILAFIVLGAGLLLSGRVAPQYTAHGGFLPKGALAPLLAMGFAIYTFAGIEFVAITTGESRSPGEIPRAIKLTFAILTSVYLGAIVILVGVMPWNRAGVTESPFVTVFRQAHIPAAPHIMTFVILTAALSGANAALYASSRILFSLARTGWAPAALGRLNASGSPQLALLASSYGIVVALVLEKWAPKNAFVSILGAALVGMLLSWLVSLAAHVRFRQQTFSEPARRFADALAARRLGFGAGLRADHRGVSGNRLALSPDADQRRGLHGGADRGVLPAEEESQGRTLVSAAFDIDLGPDLDFDSDFAQNQNQLQKRRTRVSASQAYIVLILM